MSRFEEPDQLRTFWQSIIAELHARSGKNDSDFPSISARQRGYLELVAARSFVNNCLILATPHATARQSIEKELHDPLVAILNERVGAHCFLAVIEDPDALQYEESVLVDNPAPRNAQNSAHQQGAQSSPPQNSRQQQPQPLLSHNPEWERQAVYQQVQDSRYQTEFSASEGWQSLPHVSPHSPAYTQPRDHGSYNRVPHQRDSHVAPPYGHVSNYPSGQPLSRYEREPVAPRYDVDRSLNPRFTFDTFVIGSSNRFAHAAAVAVAENPAKAFNPLFIWGGSGLGKTHLLHAAGNYAQSMQQGLRVKYVSSEQFTNDYINSVRDDRQEKFKQRYRNLDVLMVDDIQFLEGKEGTQEEFFHTFNALHQADKQIILSSDRPPKELMTLEDRLRTRFAAGLITDIQPPDLETRIAILSKKAQADGVLVPDEVLRLIASRFESSIRELEGALIRVTAFSSLNNKPISVDLAEHALHDIMPESAHTVINADTIIAATSDYFGVKQEELVGSGKVRSLAHARQIAMYLCRELTELSLPKIGSKFGGKDHTTVLYACKKITKKMTADRQTYTEIQELTQHIKTGARR